MSVTQGGLASRKVFFLLWDYDWMPLPQPQRLTKHTIISASLEGNILSNSSLLCLCSKSTVILNEFYKRLAQLSILGESWWRSFLDCSRLSTVFEQLLPWCYGSKFSAQTLFLQDVRVRPINRHAQTDIKSPLICSCLARRYKNDNGNI